jgi:hypothetical protein
MTCRRMFTALLALFIAAGLGLATSPGAAAAGLDRKSSASVVLAWEREAMDVIYPAVSPTPIPIGVPYLGFTSLAMYDAARAAGRVHGSQAAAVAAAAHDVLAAYFPASAARLDATLEATLAELPRGKVTRRGADAGHRVAARLIEDRADDGRNDTSIVYHRDPAPGVWQPAPNGAMLAPWLGFVRPLVVDEPVTVDGPDALGSAAYAADYDEVKRFGGETGSERTTEQTNTARFFNSNSAVMFGQALIAHLEQHPRSLLATAQLFAAMHTSMTDTLITCFRLKYDVGFWRPVEAIRGADTDGNDATVADPTWASLLPNPPYADYVSGHGCLTAPAVQTLRQTLGETTSLTLHSVTVDRDISYPDLTSIETAAFHSRIWGGLHFRDAMEDAYSIGHRTADLALAALGCRASR